MSSQCHQLVYKRPKSPSYLIKVEHYVSIAGFCLSQHSLYVLNRDINRTQTESFIYSSFHLVSALIGISMGRGNSTVVSVSVYQVGNPGSRPPRSACHRKVELYHCAIDLLPPVPKTGSKKAVHVLLCLCNNACKRSLAICHKSRALCPVSRFLSVPI